MVIMESGQAGAVAVRRVVEAGRSVSEPVTIQYLQMAGKIATSRGWGPAKNALIVLSALARVSQLSVDEYIAMTNERSLLGDPCITLVRRYCNLIPRVSP